MQKFGSITTLDAFKDLGVHRLSARIHDLRSQGNVIVSRPETAKNRFGQTITYSRYSIIEAFKKKGG